MIKVISYSESGKKTNNTRRQIHPSFRADSVTGKVVKLYHFPAVWGLKFNTFDAAGQWWTLSSLN